MTDQPYEVPETADDDYSSVIAYRRDLGPPPGFLLLERRSYYNRACERSADQSYFNRIFIPVPNPPLREACTDLSLPASAHGAGADAPQFVRISEAYALLPEAFSRNYGKIDHRFILTLFDRPGCSGASITLPSSTEGRPADYRLSDYEFDRKVKSVMIRYQRGPLERYLAEAPAEAESALTPPPAPTSPSAAMPSPPPAPQAPQPPQAPQAASPYTAPAAPSAAPQQPLASPPPAGGGLQPAPPSAPAQQPQQALQPIPQPQVAPAPAPSRPTGPQEETFRFPVFQVYRLNFCLAEDKGCGEPAATAWCKSQGFERASRWSQEDNIGALYPTIFIGSGGICDKFLCDGFEEITCSH